MVNALFTALALIAAGQAGSSPPVSTSNQARSCGMNETPAPVQAGGRATTAESRRNG